MRSLRILTLVSVLALFSSCGDDASSRVNKKNVEKVVKAEVDKENAPKMTFEETKFDFGDIVEGDVVETVFKFTNTGKSPLIITNARASCGCTVADYPREPIQVGESGEIKTKFNSRGKHGKQNKRITLTTNSDKGRELLYVLANVAKKEKEEKK